MITVYASIVPQATFPGNVVLTLAARDDATPIATGTPVLFTIQLKTVGQAWTTVGLFPTSLIIDANVAHIAHTALSLPLSVASFDAKITARLYAGGPTSAAVIVPYRAAAAVPLADPRARFVTYKSVLDGFLKRRGHGARNPASDDVLDDAAEFITSAYRYALEFMQWPEATLGHTLTITGGFVPWSMIFGADHYQFWTADPNVKGSCALPIRVRDRDAGGLHLETVATTVFAKFTPRPPEFRAEPVEPTSRYPYGEIRYDVASGNMYEVVNVAGALGSDLADRNQWRCLQLLWVVADVVKLLSLADALGNSEQERAQAADLREQADGLLNKIGTRVVITQPAY